MMESIKKILYDNGWSITCELFPHEYTGIVHHLNEKVNNKIQKVVIYGKNSTLLYIGMKADDDFLIFVINRNVIYMDDGFFIDYYKDRLDTFHPYVCFRYESFIKILQTINASYNTHKLLSKNST